MAQSVQELPNEIQSIMEVREWDLRTREGVTRFKELRAKSLPTIAINGELVFEAIIPPQEELIQAIQQRYETSQ
jgi:uroporphyrinogen decarboxylase